MISSSALAPAGARFDIIRNFASNIKRRRQKRQKIFLLRSHGDSYYLTSLLHTRRMRQTSQSYCRATRSRFNRIFFLSPFSLRLASPGEPRVASHSLNFMQKLHNFLLENVGETRNERQATKWPVQPSFDARFPHAAKGCGSSSASRSSEHGRTRTSYSDGDHWIMLGVRN